jgi:hypothetical protein
MSAEPAESGADQRPLTAPEIARLADARTRRRAPRYGRFIGVGVLLGALLAAAVALLGPRGDVLGPDAIFLLLFLAFGSAGALLGGIAAVIAERRAG